MDHVATIAVLRNIKLKVFEKMISCPGCITWLVLLRRAGGFTVPSTTRAAAYRLLAIESSLPKTLQPLRNCSGLLTTFGGSQGVFVLRAWQPQAAMPAAQKDASRRRRRGIKHLNSYNV